MILIADPETFWLNITNVALGLATFSFLFILAKAALKDLRGKHN
jgi:hypothetical protein